MNSDIVFTNRVFRQALTDSSLGLSEFNTPDTLTVTPSGVIIPRNFILCRDEYNVPTAIYKNDKWNVTPYILSSKSNETIYFGDLKCTDENKKDQSLVDEVKRIGVFMMYFINAGTIGALAVSTISRYINTAKRAAFFCIETSKDKMIGRLTLKELFTNKVYLAFYIKTLDKRSKQRLHALLKKLNVVGKDRLGYEVTDYINLHEQIPHNQYPVIPTRIYLEMVNYLTDKVEFLKENTEQLESFIKLFADRYYGLSTEVQKDRMFEDGIAPRDRVFRPIMSDAIKLNGLNKLSAHYPFKCTTRKEFIALLGVIQHEMKSTIHMYTGMRNDEVNRLNYDCILEKTTHKVISDKKGNILSPSSVVNIISTTTKFTGFHKEESWLAPSIVIDAISILRRIVRGISYLVGVEASDCRLFLTTSPITAVKKKPNLRKIFKSPRSHRKFNLIKPQFIINKNDYDVLIASDPERNFSASPEFNCGKPWPVTSHQFRRSLAFYAVNSGFVSLPTLKKQFKHLSQEMTKYYSRNNENVMTIFGHYDVKSKEYVLPLNHIAYELQTGMSLATAESLLKDLLSEDSTLHGKTGGYFEKQREKLKNDEALVEELIENTAKKVHDGEVSYRKTLLGGCTNIDICSCSILGEFADCLTSQCAVIKSENIEKLIKSTQKELSYYDKSSVEYLSTKSELEELVSYKKYNVERNSE
ncbi:MAG: integrase [Flavobacteriales bacterium]|jgi:integrase